MQQRDFSNSPCEADGRGTIEIHDMKTKSRKKLILKPQRMSLVLTSPRQVKIVLGKHHSK